MQLSFVVFGLAVLVAVLVKPGDARATPSRDELLDELTEELVVRYLDRTNLERSVQSIDSQGIYDKGTVRRWWKSPSYNTNNQQSASNTGNIGGNGINGDLAAGSIIGSNQGRSIDSQGIYDQGTVRRWWKSPSYNTNNQQSASNTGNIGGNGINGDLAAGSIIGSNQGRSIDSQGIYDQGTVRRWWKSPSYNTNNQQSASNTGNIGGNGINGDLAAGSIIGSNQGRSIDSQGIYDQGTVRRWWKSPSYNTNNQQSASNTGNIGGNGINGNLAAGSIIGSNQGRSIDSQGIYDQGTVRRWWNPPSYNTNNQQSASNTGNIGGNGINGNLAAGSIIGSNQGRSIDSQGIYDQGTVRRWWNPPSYNTNNQQSASNTGNIGGNAINGNLAAGSIIGSNQGRSIDSQGIYDQGTVRRWWNPPSYNTNNQQSASNTGNIGGNGINGDLAAGSIINSNQGRK